MKKLVAKVLLRGVFVFAFLFQINTLVFAADVKYTSVDISAVCEDNGTAHITEVWKMDAHSGTEMYLEKNLDGQVISNLKVKSDEKEYQNVENWNVNASLSDKAYKCGIVKNGTGCELCWGLSSYGTHTFNISYDITNLVKNCSDGAFIDQTFISKRSEPVETSKITIEKKGYRFTNDNTRMWAGGGASGNSFVTNGKIETKLTSALSNGSKFAILAQFSKGVFSPEVYVDTSFQQLKDNAFKGSDYQKNYDEWKSQGGNKGESTNYTGGKSNTLEAILLVVAPFIVVPLVGSIFGIFKLNGTRISNDKFIKEYSNPNYCRELPFHDNIFASYTRLKSLKKLENECEIIGVYILKWIQNHNVELTKVETKKFFKTKLEDAIKLNSLPEDTHLLEKKLFDFMLSASDKDSILRNKDFEKWCKENFSSFDGWLKRYDEKGFSDLKEMGAIIEKDKKFMGFINYTKNEISEIGVKLTSEMFGFKKYLEDFTIINEREAKEVELWEDYIIYAQLFGIADKVSEQFRSLYPKYFEENFNLGTNAFDIILINNLANSYVNLAHSSYVNAFNSNAQTAFEGLGGSFSGSGGFSGSSGDGSCGVR